MGRGRGGGRGKGAEKKTQQPKTGESHVKVINDVNHTLCGWCADFKPNHSTEENAEKCSQFNPNSHSGYLRAAQAAAKAAAQSEVTPPVATQGGQPAPASPGFVPIGQTGSTGTSPAATTGTPAAGSVASTPGAPSGRGMLLRWSGAGLWVILATWLTVIYLSDNQQGKQPPAYPTMPPWGSTVSIDETLVQNKHLSLPYESYGDYYEQQCNKYDYYFDMMLGSVPDSMLNVGLRKY
eukprot:337476-Ditylum_brightwellii.AAC.1